MTAEVGSPGLAVRGVTMRFGAAVAVDDVSLDVAPGEIVALVGPSGCGKSTLLRVVAGLEQPAEGTVAWDGVDVIRVPAHQRGFGLMFQDHALFVHRDVGRNVAFGLRMHGMDRAQQRARVAEVLALVGLDGFEGRTIDTLSGGEAQRVALARALAPSPRLLMLDEPLGSLDRTLRDRLAQDLRSVLSTLGTAAIHVTHDQEEAYAVADRLVVMRAGRVVRDGAAGDVWRDPRSRFVARFLGHEDVLEPAAAAALGLSAGARPVVVREAAIRIVDDPAALRCEVTDIRFRGATSRVTLRVGGPDDIRVDLTVHLADPPPLGSVVRVRLDPEHISPLPDSEPDPGSDHP